jgi:hypothetical protein
MSYKNKTLATYVIVFYSKNDTHTVVYIMKSRWNNVSLPDYKLLQISFT